MYIEKKKKRIKNYRVAILKVSFRSPKQRGSTRPCFWPPHLGRRYYWGLPTTDGRILDTTTPVTAYLLFWERATRERTPSTAFVSIAYPHWSYIRRNLIEKLTRKVDAISYVQRARLVKRNDIRNSQSVLLYIIDYNLWYSRKFSNYEINRNREKTFF